MENDPFAEDVRAGVLDDIERLGMRVVIDDQLAPELNDMSATLTKVKALKPDVLIISGQEKGAITAVTQMKALNVYVPVVAMTHCDSAQLAEKLPAAEYVLCAMQWHRTLNYQASCSPHRSSSPPSSRAGMAMRLRIRRHNRRPPWKSSPTPSSGRRVSIR
ncbi:MAG: ABC transporter substrate-binding protein [Methyloceanibacter sp.]|uniref:ABC transporter substrate-binding protein n=1 Tax=Methyloceanibacter sp. TaxID=1965321 RepID=UPI003D9BDE4F